MKPPTYILNYGAVVDFFGHWPIFHDAKVIVYLPPKDGTKALCLTLHTWLMTNEVDTKGFFVLRNHALVSFRFKEIFDVNMEKFNSGNILFDLQFFSSSDPSSFRVELNSVMDMDGSFSAKYGEVVSLRPCTKEGKELEQN